jgi:hypothetical protein
MRGDSRRKISFAACSYWDTLRNSISGEILDAQEFSYAESVSVRRHVGQRDLGTGI